MADVARAVACPVVLVVRLRLGCLGRARLTREAIAASGCRFAGWIGNQVDPDFSAPEANLATLTRLLGSAPLASLPHSPRGAGDAQQAAGALTQLLAMPDRRIT